MTISLRDAARWPWDAVVAGAGPAGAVCAFMLAQRGIAVLLVDKSEFPRNKVCGSCLNGAALAALAAAGLGDLPARLGGVPLGAMQLRSGGREATLPLPSGVALSRRAFDAALVRAAVDAGAAFLPQTEALLDPACSAPHKIQLHADGESAFVSARIAVAADGLAGGFLKSIEGMAPVIAAHSPMGAGAVLEDASDQYPPGTIFMGCTLAGYLGVVRLEDGHLDVALALDRGQAQSAGGTKAAAVAILRESGLPSPTGLADATFRGTPYLTRRRPQVAADGLLVIGDAAGYVEPLTGEGMAWAMQQAILAAPVIGKAIAGCNPSHALQWQEHYARLFRYRRGVCLAATWLRRNFRFGSFALGMLARMPGLAAPWVRAVNRPAPEILRSIAP